MKNAYVLYDPVTNEIVGSGVGAIDKNQIGAAVVRYRDYSASVRAEPSVQAETASRQARADISKINSADRSQAFTRKDYYARQFLADTDTVADKTLTGAAGVAAIDATLYPPIHKEYAATHHLIDWTPWQLCEAITAKANAIDDQEANRRGIKLTAESVLAQPRPTIPDE
jgi:hypothetical protein